MRSRKDGLTDGRYKRRILTPVERDGLNRELRTIEADRAGDAEGIPRRMRGFIDTDIRAEHTDVLDAREKRVRNALAAGAPEPLSGPERSKLESDEKVLREKLIAQMLPRKMMTLKPGSLDFTKARNLLAKNEMSAEFNRAAASWKNIRRQLDPEDPGASSLENIRPD